MPYDVPFDNTFGREEFFDLQSADGGSAFPGGALHGLSMGYQHRGSQVRTVWTDNAFLRSNLHTPGGGWQGVTQPDVAQNQTISAYLATSVGIDHSGRSAVAYYRLDQALVTNHSDTSGNWLSPTTLKVGFAGQPWFSVVTGDDISWVFFMQNGIHYALYDHDVLTVTNMIAVDPTTNPAPPLAFIDDAGNAILIYFDNTTDAVELTTSPGVSPSFTTPVPVSGPNASRWVDLVGTSAANGDILIGWLVYDSVLMGGASLHTMRYRGGAWSPVEDVYAAPNGSVIEAPVVALDPTGRAGAAWVLRDTATSHTDVMGALFE
jgi:hypothetical protein